jgi:phosphatidylserine/phosphatidylglycerophosphate/cardiolipin synthase-like enzyme
MERLGLHIILTLFLFIPACQQAPGDSPAPEPAARSLPPIEVYFSPKGGCTEAVVRELGAAQQSVLVQAYSFTSAPIAKALVEAHKRGVKVEVILDKSQRTEKYSEADFLVNLGIPVRIDAKHAIAHNKIMVIDGETVITGSFNFTKAAEEHNAENLLVIRDATLAEKYAANWQAHAEHSEAYEGRGGDAALRERVPRRKAA